METAAVGSALALRCCRSQVAYRSQPNAHNCITPPVPTWRKASKQDVEFLVGDDARGKADPANRLLVREYMKMQ